MAVVFDLARLEVASSPPVPLSEQVVEGSEGAWYGISPSGSLAYVADSPGRQERKLVWVNRSGDVETVPAPPKVYDAPRISPDGRRVAASVRGGVIGTWIYDLSRATLTPLTSGGSSQSPIWTPDGKRVAYRGTRSGFRNLFWRAVDGTGTEERLTTSDSLETPGSFSPDGAFLAFNSLGSATGGDIWVLPLQGDRKPRPWLQAPLAQGNAMFSPDGRWIAYVSSESGRDEVYVQPFPGPGEKSQISTEGGREPLWAGSGKELFYRDGEKMMVVEVSTQPGFSAGRPRLLFEGRYEYSPTGTTGYDVSSDGQRFLMVQATEPEEAPTQIHVVLNWFEELKRRVPAGQ
jgi:serine/threonine-protein kinase